MWYVGTPQSGNAMRAPVQAELRNALIERGVPSANIAQASFGTSCSFSHFHTLRSGVGYTMNQIRWVWPVLRGTRFPWVGMQDSADMVNVFPIALGPGHTTWRYDLAQGSRCVAKEAEDLYKIIRCLGYKGGYGWSWTRQNYRKRDTPSAQQHLSCGDACSSLDDIEFTPAQNPPNYLMLQRTSVHKGVGSGGLPTTYTCSQKRMDARHLITWPSFPSGLNPRLRAIVVRGLIWCVWIDPYGYGQDELGARSFPYELRLDSGELINSGTLPPGESYTAKMIVLSSPLTPGNSGSYMWMSTTANASGSGLCPYLAESLHAYEYIEGNISSVCYDFTSWQYAPIDVL